MENKYSTNLKLYKQKKTFPQLFHLESIIFFAASAYLKSCFLASDAYFGFISLTGMSFMISLYMDCDTSGVQFEGSIGSLPLSMTFLSSNQRLNDSTGASIASKKNYKYLHI